jgi:hypothetical protein
VLSMRSACDRCRAELPLDAAELLVCDCDCAFCQEWIAVRFGGLCPRCGEALLGVLAADAPDPVGE